MGKLRSGWQGGPCEHPTVRDPGSGRFLWAPAPQGSGRWGLHHRDQVQAAHTCDLRVCGFQPHSSAHSCWNSAKCLTTSYLILPTSMGGRHHVPIYRWSKMRLRGTVTHPRSQGKRISGPEPLTLTAAPLSWRALPCHAGDTQAQRSH